MDREGWDTRYAAEERVFSSEPNPVAAEVLADLAPGRALDLAAGEGRHALWLARRGWHVTAVDFSAVGLAKGRGQADREGLAIDWVESDAYAYAWPEGGLDLVLIAHFHPEPSRRAGVFGAAVRALVPGGRLLVLGRHVDDIGRDGGRGPREAALRYRPEVLATELPEELRLDRCESVARTVEGRDGSLVAIRDVVAYGARMGDARPPTSHERRAGQSWDASYADGPAPWDIGGPQPAMARLVSEGAFTGEVLDAGCGTGENALHVAASGLRVLGVDVAETAIAMAREEAARRGSEARFEVADALRLGSLRRGFDTVLDCGLFHTFDDDERRAYVASLASVTRAGGSGWVLCFSDAEPGASGPHPVSRAELLAAFGTQAGWRVVEVRRERIATRSDARGASAWLARVERVPPP